MKDFTSALYESIFSFAAATLLSVSAASLNFSVGSEQNVVTGSL